MCKELPPATAGLSGTTRWKARLNRSTPCASRRGGGYRTEPIPFACSDERGCHLPTSQRSRSITQIKAGPFCQGSNRFQFPARRHRLSSQFASWDPSRRRYRWLGRKFPLGTDFLPYLPSTVAKVTFFAVPRPALIKSPTLGAYFLGFRPRNFDGASLASLMALTT